MFDPSVIMEMLKNPEQVIKTLIQDYDKCSKNREAMDKTLTKLRDNPSLFTENPNNLVKLLEGQVVSNRALNDINTRLLLLLIVYSSGDSLTSDTAKVAVKLGQGEEALQEMFKRKMGK